MDEHGLQDPTLIGHYMGAKTAMALALQSPEIIHDIVSVDNAPVDVALLSNFGKYIQGMKKIEEAGVTRQAEADQILKDYEEVGTSRRFMACYFLMFFLLVSPDSPIPVRQPPSICG